MVSHYSARCNIKIKRNKIWGGLCTILQFTLSHMTYGFLRHTFSYSYDKNNNLQASFLVFLLKSTKINNSFTCTVTTLEYDNILLARLKCV